jgi:uracil-DNA glycosylase family 4
MSLPLVETIVPLAERYLEYQRDMYGPELFWQSHFRPTSTSDKGTKKALDDFRLDIQQCRKCGLCKTRTRFVFGTGNPNANLMLVGEAPGEEEDKQGEPFVGAAGQLLDKILASIEFKREEVYICNILKCRPPMNRDPLPEEVVACISHLYYQIEIIDPKLILALGRVAAQNLLNTQAPLNRLRGTVHDRNGIPLLVTFHPAALLHNPEWKRSTWEDVQKLRKLYDERVGDKPEWNPSKRKM